MWLQFGGGFLTLKECAINKSAGVLISINNLQEDLVPMLHVFDEGGVKRLGIFTMPYNFFHAFPYVV